MATRARAQRRWPGAKRLREAATDRGLTGKLIAAKIQRPVRTVNHYLSGERWPNPKTLALLFDVVGLPTDPALQGIDGQPEEMVGGGVKQGASIHADEIRAAAHDVFPGWVKSTQQSKKRLASVRRNIRTWCSAHPELAAATPDEIIIAFLELTALELVALEDAAGET